MLTRRMEFVTQRKNLTNVEEARKNKYRKDSIVGSIAGIRPIEITTRL